MAVAQQELEDMNVIWENPDTPITSDDFIFHNGKRFVRPYFFEFIAHVKQRWDMKTIVDLFANEFRQRPRQYYIEAVNSGRILVNGKVVKNTYTVRKSETLSHFVHRHEPPVIAAPVDILELGSDVVTVCKPPSVPVHACGQYRKNTVLGILQAEHQLGLLYPIHRLDRLVSGLLILARNAHTADRFRQEIESGTVMKIYVAKVQGVFTDKEVEVSAPVIYDAKEGRSTVEEGEIQVKENGIDRESKLSFKKGKHAFTRFRCLYTDGVYSIVECVPLTGRTHQIRVHLQYLGHPIANDALYVMNNPPKRTEMGTNAERAARSGDRNNSDSLISSIFTSDSTTFSPNTKKRKAAKDSSTSQICDKSEVLMRESHEESKPYDKCIKRETSLDLRLTAGKDVEFVVDPLCTHCPYLSAEGYEDEEQGLWLHCKSYSGQGWKYECPLPAWARLPSECLQGR